MAYDVVVLCGGSVALPVDASCETCARVHVKH